MLVQARKCLEDKPIVKRFNRKDKNPSLNFLCYCIYGLNYKRAKLIVDTYDLYSLDETPIYLVENDVDENNKLLIQSNIRFDKKINDLGFEEISFYYQNNDDSEELIFIPNSDLVLL